MTKTIRGAFTVDITPVNAEAGQHAEAIMHATLAKRYTGPLTAESKGHMLSHTTATRGSAGYVALEHVVGQIEGRTGSFVLQHSGSMNRGVAHLQVDVVPDSATGELTGLSGTVDIEVDDGHRYTMTYTLPDQAAS